MKRISISLLVLFTLLLYRTQIFNVLIEYVPEQQVVVQELNNSYWKNEVDKIISIHSFVGIAELNDRIVEIIASKLKFGKNQISADPNEFRDGSEAHCVGYSALNASLLTYACKKLNSEIYKVSHVRGKIKFLGIEITSKIHGNFYKDHDFVKIENKSIDKHYFSDATIYELFKISRIKLKYGM